MNFSLEQLLRRDRMLVGASLILVSALCWAWILAGAGLDMDSMPAPAWSAPHVLLMFFMWWIMMIAMMLPGATPIILLAAALNRRSESQIKPYGRTGAFMLGYILAWAIFSAIAVFAQWGLQESGFISVALRSNSPALSAGLLIAAGAWQFSHWKNACLRHCRGPVEFLTRYRRAGDSGALIMGLQHGSYCLGCCWFLMALLFVGGVMNPLWIAGLAVYVWMEKVLPAGEFISRLMGGILIAWGVVVLFGENWGQVQ